MTALSTLHTPAADQSTTQRCSICQGMEPELHRQLQRLGRIKRYAAGEIIVGEEEEAPFVGTVTSGVLRMQKTLYDGRQLIVGLLMPSDMFGRVFSSTSNVSIEAATDVTLYCYSRAGFEILLSQFPALEHRMLLSMLDELEGAQNWMLLLGCQSVTERIATFLLILRRRSAKLQPDSVQCLGNSVTIPISRRDMAAYLGTTVESISRSIQEMARHRVLSIINPQQFRILDERRLIELSGREDSEMKLSFPMKRTLRTA